MASKAAASVYFSNSKLGIRSLEHGPHRLLWLAAPTVHGLWEGGTRNFLKAPTSILWLTEGAAWRPRRFSGASGAQVPTA